VELGWLEFGRERFKAVVAIPLNYRIHMSNGREGDERECEGNV
jgi:hypothetical protein